MGLTLLWNWCIRPCVSQGGEERRGRTGRAGRLWHSLPEAESKAAGRDPPGTGAPVMMYCWLARRLFTDAAALLCVIPARGVPS